MPFFPKIINLDACEIILIYLYVYFLFSSSDIKRGLR